MINLLKFNQTRSVVFKQVMKELKNLGLTYTPGKWVSGVTLSHGHRGLPVLLHLPKTTLKLGKTR